MKEKCSCRQKKMYVFLEKDVRVFGETWRCFLGRRGREEERIKKAVLVTRTAFYDISESILLSVRGQKNYMKSFILTGCRTITTYINTCTD